MTNNNNDIYGDVMHPKINDSKLKGQTFRVEIDKRLKDHLNKFSKIKNKEKTSQSYTSRKILWKPLKSQIWTLSLNLRSRNLFKVIVSGLDQFY